MLTRQAVTIGTGATGLSDETIDLRTHRIIAVAMPADWTTGSITFQSSPDDPDAKGPIGTGGPVPLQDVVDDGGTEVSLTVAADQYVVLDKDARSELDGLAFTKIRSGTSDTPVTQGAERVLVLVVEPR